jgi:chemotaxis signal transduction protein
VDASPAPALTIDDPWASDAALQAQEAESHVVVRMGNGRYALELTVVAEVLPLPSTTRLPGGPLWLDGIANWRGRVLPVLDLRPLLGAERRPAASSARLVVLRHEDVEAGVLVDAVLGLLTWDTELLEVPGTVPPAAASILSGTVDDGRPVAVLDAVSVLALRGQLAQAASAW